MDAEGKGFGQVSERSIERGEIIGGDASIGRRGLKTEGVLFLVVSVMDGQRV